MIPLLFGTLTLALWALAMRRYGRRFKRAYPLARTCAFGTGILLLTVSLGPPLDVLADGSFAWHMVQHIILLMVVPPLVLLAHPLTLLLAILPATHARTLTAVLRRPPLRWFGSPFFGFLFFVAVMWVVHFSGLYEAAAENEWIHACEHALFLAAAFAFWAPVTGSTPFPTPLPFAARIFYLFVAMPPSAFLGFALHESRSSPYAHYPSLDDIRNGGDIMWMAGGALMFVALMTVAYVWARREERYAAQDTV
jgi:putative membrane protein